jgi:hypothetical protein
VRPEKNGLDFFLDFRKRKVGGGKLYLIDEGGEK